MTLFKTSILSFFATIVKMLAALVINKAVAIYIGPAGLALVGQFQNFSQLVMTMAQGAINTGVVKYTAEYNNNEPQLSVLFSTAGKISLISSIVVGSSMVLLSSSISFYVLKSEGYAYIFLIFGFTIVLFVINSLLLSILNGLKEIKTFIAINIIQSIYSLIFTTILVIFFGLDGALIALVTNQSVIFLVVLWMLKKHPLICLSTFTQEYNQAQAKKLMHYAIMAITSAISVPVSHFLIRSYIGENLSWDAAGYWQAIWSISTMYLMVITTTLSVYYLPRLAELNHKAELRKELIYGFKMLIPLLCVMSLIIFLLRDFIVKVLFSQEFYPMLELFLWQFIGDIIKMASWLLAYVMLAKAMTKAFVISEIIFSILFVFLAIIMIEAYGLIGVTYAFALNYLLYFFVILLVVKQELYE